MQRITDVSVEHRRDGTVVIHDETSYELEPGQKVTFGLRYQREQVSVPSERPETLKPEHSLEASLEAPSAP
jgi:hypothetical protein